MSALGMPFRLALVGAGMIAQGSHLPAVLASRKAELVAIVDPVVERAAHVARSYGLSPRIAARVEDVFGYIDGAIIATPNDTHGTIAISCLRNNVPVLIEKPLASSYEEGLEIVHAAQQTGQTVAVGYSTRFRDEISLLKELLEEEYFGEVRRFVHQFGTPGGWAPFSAYNLKRTSAGGGVLVVTGTHFLDRMLYFWGYPDEAMLEDDSLEGPEANCSATFRYAGAQPFDGLARYSKTVKLPAGMVIETAGGYVVLGDSEDAPIVFRPHSKGALEHVIRRRGGVQQLDPRSVYQRQLEDFIDACRDNRPPMVDALHGAESLKLLEQLYANRKMVDPDWYINGSPA